MKRWFFAGLIVVLTVNIGQPAEGGLVSSSNRNSNSNKQQQRTLVMFPPVDVIYPIVGGIISSPKTWPWIALLLAPIRFVWKEPKCGGSLIDRRHVLTAAHCLYAVKRKDLVVRLGEFDRRTFTDSVTADYTVSRFIIHPNYVNNAFNNDLALLRLSKPVQLSPFIQPIPLPTGVTGDLAGRTVRVAGWGSTTKYKGRNSNVLWEVSLPAIAKNQCKNKYAQNLLIKYFQAYFPGGFIGNTKLCAGTKKGGKGACSGDSGGPMVIQQRGGQYRLVGVVSGGSGCGSSVFPTIYTRVNAYIHWIKRHTIIPKNSLSPLLPGKSHSSVSKLLIKFKPKAQSPSKSLTPLQLGLVTKLSVRSSSKFLAKSKLGIATEVKAQSPSKFQAKSKLGVVTQVKAQSTSKYLAKSELGIVTNGKAESASKLLPTPRPWPELIADQLG